MQDNSNKNNTTIGLELADEEQNSCLIKVLGVGGGGGNAVNYIYNDDLTGVGCMAINTDKAALKLLQVPIQIAISELGSGSNPEVARMAAEKNVKLIREMLKGTEMLIITAGFGKGTGTGASPVVARVAKEMGILTIAVITTPFRFEGTPFMNRALYGISELRRNVDSLLIIANERIKNTFGNMPLRNAFSIADKAISNAINGISSLVYDGGMVNCDMNDVRTTLTGGGDMVMGLGVGDGPDRAVLAINHALESDLMVNRNFHTAKRLIMSYTTHDAQNEITIDEMNAINEVLDNQCSECGELERLWGSYRDESMSETALKVTIIITGMDELSDEEFKEKAYARDIQKPRNLFVSHKAETTPEAPMEREERVKAVKPAPQKTVEETPRPEQKISEVAPQVITIKEVSTAPATEKRQPAAFSLEDMDELDNDSWLSEFEKPINLKGPKPCKRKKSEDIILNKNPDDPISTRNKLIDDNVD